MAPHPRLRVLVVDDDRLQNDLLCLWLKGTMVPDFDPVPAYSLAGAYKALAGDVFDLVLLDRRLGDGDGLEALRWIRGDARNRAMPVVIMSGLCQEKQVIHGLERGADDYLPKPCSEELFRARVLAVLKRNRAPATSQTMSGPGFQLDAVNGRLYVYRRAGAEAGPA